MTRGFCATRLVAAVVVPGTTRAFWEALARGFCASRLIAAEALDVTRAFGEALMREPDAAQRVTAAPD